MLFKLYSQSTILKLCLNNFQSYKMSNNVLRKVIIQNKQTILSVSQYKCKTNSNTITKVNQVGSINYNCSIPSWTINQNLSIQQCEIVKLIINKLTWTVRYEVRTGSIKWKPGPLVDDKRAPP